VDERLDPIATRRSGALGNTGGIRVVVRFKWERFTGFSQSA
jgi:hypothetical protein